MRIIVVSWEVSFRVLSVKRGELASRNMVSSVRYRPHGQLRAARLGDMCNEYDGLNTTRLSATFRLFFSIVVRPRVTTLLGHSGWRLGCGMCRVGWCSLL